MSASLDNLIRELYGDYRVKNKDVVKFQKFVGNANMDRYALFDDIKQVNRSENDNNSSETVNWLISNHCYTTIYPRIIEFMSQYLTDPKREEMLNFLTDFLERFTSQSRHKLSITYLKKFQAILSKLFAHQKQFIKNMDDNRLTLNLRYHDEYNQFRPLLTILMQRIYDSFDSNHYIHSFEYLNIFQLFLENGANPINKTSDEWLSFKRMIQILDVLYGLYPMIIKNKIVEELVINKYLSLLTYGKRHDCDDMESWFPTILTIKRNTHNNTCISFVNDAFLNPYSYKWYAHKIEQKQCIQSIYCLKHLLIRGFNIIDIQNNGIIDAIISKSQIIKHICFQNSYINNPILRGKIILLLWILKILIIEIRDEFVSEFHKIYNESHDEFKEECGGTAVSYSVWIMIMDYGIVNKLTFLNQIDDNYFVQHSDWVSLHKLSPQIIIFIFNNILNKLSENNLKFVVNKMSIDAGSFIEIFKIMIFQNNDKQYDNKIILKMFQYLLVDNNYNNRFLIKQLFDTHLMQKIFESKDTKMLSIYSDIMYKYYQYNYHHAKNDIVINFNLLNQYLFSAKYSNNMCYEKIKALFPQKLMQLCSIQMLQWIFSNESDNFKKEKKLKFVIDEEWIHVLVLILDKTNIRIFRRILESIYDHRILNLLLSYLTKNVKEFKNEDNYKQIKKTLRDTYFNIHFKFHQKRNVKCGDIVTKYMSMLQ